MKLLTVTQGSPAWHAARANHFCASEAPAMLGVSKYTTRTELLTQKKTGITEEVNPGKQRLFDAGHQAEAAARPLAEAIIGQELYPTVGTREVNGLPMLASLDGQTMDETIIWETKLWNESLAQACASGELEPHYWAQLEHQLIVSQADSALFTTSDGTEERTAQVWYKSIPERRQQVLQGWAQFAEDLATFTPAVIEAAPVGRTPETLPALHIEVTGMVTASNLAEYKAHALAVFASINRELVTDAHFADAEKTVKWCGDIETRLAAAKQHALSQTASIDQLFKTIDDISAEARATRLELDKLVKNRKDSIRAEIVADGRTAMIDHIAALNKRIGSALMPAIAYDFANAIKGKRTLDSMRDAVNTELARCKIEATAIATKIAQNVKVIEDAGHVFLFSDRNTLALKDPEFVSMTVKTRVDKHQADESARLAAETARIAEEERVKAEASAQARANAEIAEATAKARAEAHAQAAADAEAKRASDEVIAKAKSEVSLSAPIDKEEPSVSIAIIAPVAMNNVASLAGKNNESCPPTLKLGQICARLDPENKGFTMSADFLRSLGFEPAGRERAAVLYYESQFPAICLQLVRHVQKVAQGVAA